MADGDLHLFRIAAADHARKLKALLHEAKQLQDWWGKIGLLNDSSPVAAPLTKDNLTNYASLCGALQEFADNVQVAAADRRAVIERMGTQPIV